jgi:predicted acetyltransferase
MAVTSYAPTGLTIRTAEDADRPAIALLEATCFGRWPAEETAEVWRSMMPDGGMVVACDGDDIVGQAAYLDLTLTVPGGARLPMAGVTEVAVAPTHRRRGVLRAMLAELHSRMGGYPIAGLEASEGGIYGRFGYGPATVVHKRTIEGRKAEFHADVPDPGGVRIARPVECRDRLEDLYERWRRQHPGGVYSPPQLWDEVLADRETARHGASSYFCLLHPDGYAMYRTRGNGEQKNVEVTKLVALTTDAHIALWRVLLGMDLISTVTAWTAPDDPLPYLLTDPRLVRTGSVDDGLWLRLLDVPTVLEARTYAADVSVVLDIDHRGYALEVRDGRARCVPTSDDADVHMDLSVLGSLYMGSHRASGFAAAGRLRSADAGVVAQLDAAFATDVAAQLGYGF